MFPFWVDFSGTALVQLMTFTVVAVTWLTATLTGHRAGG